MSTFRQAMLTLLGIACTSLVVVWTSPNSSRGLPSGSPLFWVLALGSALSFGAFLLEPLVVRFYRARTGRRPAAARHEVLEDGLVRLTVDFNDHYLTGDHAWVRVRTPTGAYVQSKCPIQGRRRSASAVFPCDFSVATGKPIERSDLIAGRYRVYWDLPTGQYWKSDAATESFAISTAPWVRETGRREARTASTYSRRLHDLLYREPFTTPLGKRIQRAGISVSLILACVLVAFVVLGEWPLSASKIGALLALLSFAYSLYWWSPRSARPNPFMSVLAAALMVVLGFWFAFREYQNTNFKSGGGAWESYLVNVISLILAFGAGSLAVLNRYQRYSASSSSRSSCNAETPETSGAGDGERGQRSETGRLISAAILLVVVLQMARRWLKR